MHKDKYNQMEIKLRPYQFFDVDEFMELACNDQVIRTSRLNYYTSREDTLDYLKEVAIPHSWYKAIWVEEVLWSLLIWVEEVLFTFIIIL